MGPKFIFISQFDDLQKAAFIINYNSIVVKHSVQIITQI